MSLLESVRGLGVPAAAVLGAALVCVACSSTSSGTPEPPAGSVGSQPASSPSTLGASTPDLGDLTSNLPSVSIGSGGGSAFCTEFSTGDLTSIGSLNDLSQVLAAWDKFTADAPADIKPDFQKIDEYLHSASSGQVPSAAQTQELSTAGQHIGMWLAQNCTGG